MVNGQKMSGLGIKLPSTLCADKAMDLEGTLPILTPFGLIPLNFLQNLFDRFLQTPFFRSSNNSIRSVSHPRNPLSENDLNHYIIPAF